MAPGPMRCAIWRYANRHNKSLFFTACQLRHLASYLGLVPKQEDSGESQPQLGISKAGDTMVRRLLVGSAQYILGPFGPDTDLRRYGLRLCERGGKNAKKRAAIAVARKLAVLLHRLWASGEVYEPLRPALSTPITAAA